MIAIATDTRAYRLTKSVVPGRYDIKLRAGLDSDRFEGSVVIRLDITEPVDAIELHARDLALSDARLAVAGRVLEPTVEIDREREIAILRFDEPLPVGVATLHIAFEGKVSEGLNALYVAGDGAGQILCTQTFPTDARAIFPCFDEPDFKASFSYEITTRSTDTVLTNSPLLSVVESSAVAGPTRTWRFASTEPMSTYLVAFAVGDIASTPQEVVNGTPVRVWALKGKEEMGRFAHGYTTRLLPYYEDYFGLPYHWGKYDQVAVPNFAAGAMENAGLVTFRQQLLLMNPKTASWAQEKRIALVVAHEFAHMWFGNLATIKWWDDTWLSEAFAEWLGHKAVNALSPDYQVWDDFQGARADALETDALASSHPIYSPVQTADEAIEMFDVITYEKGCAVLRMVENFLGEESFRKGLQGYMREFAESNATGADLWRHLQAASDQPVTQIMESWIAQGGYPLLRVSLETGEGGPRLKLLQHRFRSTPPPVPEGKGAKSPKSKIQNPKSDDGPLWTVPVVVRYEDGKGVHEARYLLSEREGEVPLKLRGDLKWCYANASDIGFYRQRLEGELRDKLLGNLDKLTPAEQVGLLSDQWALVESGDQGIGAFLDVLAALANIDHYHVLRRVVGYLREVEQMLEKSGGEDAQGKFRGWTWHTFAGKLERLGFDPHEGEPVNDTQSRVYVVDAMTALAWGEEAVKQAIERAEREATDAASVDPNLAPVVVGAAAQFGDRARFDRFVEIYRQRTASGASPQEADRYLGSFPRFKAPELVAETLRLMEDGTVPQESVRGVLGQMLRRNYAQQAAWDYMKANWEKLRASSPLTAPYLIESTGHLPASLRDDLVAFCEASLHGEAQQAYARALETLDRSAELQQRTRDDLIAWFKGK